MALVGSDLLDLWRPSNVPLLPFHFFVVVLSACIAMPRPMVLLPGDVIGVGEVTPVDGDRAVWNGAEHPLGLQVGHNDDPENSTQIGELLEAGVNLGSLQRLLVVADRWELHEYHRGRRGF